MRRLPSPTTALPTGRDTGRISVFLAIAFTGLVVVFGAVVDGTGQLRTQLRAENIAAEAARAAGQAVDVDLVAARGEHRVNSALAVAYANTYLDTAQESHPGLAPNVTLGDDGTTVSIEVTLPYRNRVLGMFGRSDVNVSATATAVLVTEP
jgi:hypothetical protein